jgi:O-phosphoseryl-tRNA synthetase
MGRWNAKKISKEAKADFEGTWERTKDLVTTTVAKKDEKKPKPGSPNIIYDTISKLRNAYIDMGFDELINPLFIEDTEVHKQFGPEAVAVLDRVYFMGGLPRPDIGISEKKLAELKRINPKVDKNSIESVLRLYKKGEIGGDDLIVEIALVLKTDDISALRALDSVFPEFKDLKPVPSTMTLRSHMTSAWFLTLQSLYGKRETPIKLFSIDRCFRREQHEDSGHLRTYYSASCVILGNSFTLDEDLGIKEGMEIVEKILGKLKLGIQSYETKLDEKRSKYYAPDTQFEVFGKLQSGEDVEIATMGLYSPVALSRYGIEHPVLNIGFGVERLAMVLSGAEDIRELTYPQFYSGLSMSDEEIAAGITYDKMPTSEAGLELVTKITEVAIKNATNKSPCQVEINLSKPIAGKKVKVEIVEEEENTKLLGPAALNRIVINNGNISGVKDSDPTVFTTDKTYIEGIANLVAGEIEKAAAEGRQPEEIKIKGVKLPSDVNLKISDSVARFINSNNKKIDIRGPVFTTIRSEFS